MTISKNGLKAAFVMLLCSLYILAVSVYVSRAAPTGADVSGVSVDYGATTAPDSQQHPGGVIVTMSLSAVQQDSGWKAYIGNISGNLVLRNTEGQSIYEWALDGGALGGNIFVSRSNNVNWTPLKCANKTIIVAEDAALGAVSSASDSINRTFNYTAHRTMVVSQVGSITENQCYSTATYINGTPQVVNRTAKFQEILLTDDTSLVYASFIDQDVIGFDNKTHDFQFIVAENKTDISGHVYYFYADIS